MRLSHFRAALICFLMPPLVNAQLSVSSPTGEEVWRLDCGTDDLPAFPLDSSAHGIDGDGNLWLRDEPFSGNYRWGYVSGHSGNSGDPIDGTTRDVIYQTHRWGQTDMAYRVRLPNGLYRVKLLFAETTYGTAGSRIFDVALEGVTVLDDHDVYSHVGADTADEHVFGVTVTDEQLDVAFPEIQADNAMISGIEVYAVDVSDDSLLDFLQKRMHYYFVNHTHATTGLAPAALDDWTPETYDEGDLAVSGLGMSVLSVAVSRGWISVVDALARVNQTLTTIGSPSVRVHGFPYNRFVRDTGAVHGVSEVSSLDSALFILGAIQAGEYFRDADPTVIQQVDSLDQSMEWTWWLNRTRSGIDDSTYNLTIAKGWRPIADQNFVVPGTDAAGFFRAEWWKNYSETLLVNLAALGAPMTPVPTTVYFNMGHPWAHLFGEDILHAPTLSQHQYPHLFLI